MLSGSGSLLWGDKNMRSEKKKTFLFGDKWVMHIRNMYTKRKKHFSMQYVIEILTNKICIKCHTVKLFNN